MANHAFVIPAKMPTVKQIDKDAREICNRKFPQFTLHFDRKKNWHLQYKDDGYIGLIFWVSKYPYNKAKRPCIEFRHGHGVEWLWWVENEIREELALRYDAKVVDEGEMKFDPPQTDRYNTYAEYLSRNYGGNDDLKKFVNERIQHCLDTMPDDLKPLIGKLVT